MNSYVNRESLRKQRSKPVRVSKRLFAAVLIGFVGLFARYTVYYGHECARINPWITPSSESERVSLEEFHLLVCGVVPEEIKKGADKAGEHDHANCPVCETYEQLVNALPVEYSTNVDVVFQFTESRPEFQSTFVENRITLHQSTRAPPAQA